MATAPMVDVEYSWLAAVRNVLFLIGIGRLGIPLIGAARAAAIPLAISGTLITLFAGGSAQRPAWNVLLQTDTSTISWLMAAVAAVVGTAACIAHPYRRMSNRDD